MIVKGWLPYNFNSSMVNDKSNWQRKQEFIRLIEVVSYRGLHLWRLNCASKCPQSTMSQNVDIQVNFRSL